MSVKKISQILFVITYFFLTTGFTITIHFCSGELSNISIVRTSGEEDPCGCEPNSCEDSCCKDQIQTIKLTDSHKSEAKFNQNSFEFSFILNPVVNVSSIGYNKPHSINTHFTTDSSPPSLYLFNCIFLI